MRTYIRRRAISADCAPREDASRWTSITWSRWRIRSRSSSRSNPDRGEAVAATAHHLRSFWDPRMRREIVAHRAGKGGEGLNEIARDAVRTLEGEASAKAAG